MNRTDKFNELVSTHKITEYANGKKFYFGHRTVIAPVGYQECIISNNGLTVSRLNKDGEWALQSGGNLTSVKAIIELLDKYNGNLPYGYSEKVKKLSAKLERVLNPPVKVKKE